MAERPVHALEYPGIVNEDHARDGKTPECIQSHEAWSFGLHANSLVVRISKSSLELINHAPIISGGAREEKQPPSAKKITLKKSAPFIP
jgi:hypothetical protein